jgi:hypothetical protein
MPCCLRDDSDDYYGSQPGIKGKRDHRPLDETPSFSSLVSITDAATSFLMNTQIQGSQSIHTNWVLDERRLEA